jgi:hypothetical protein
MWQNFAKEKKKKTLITSSAIIVFCMQGVCFAIIPNFCIVF